ncbi:LOW QUALITY PROTEIN: V-set and immunoglobulin domain-containing protein 10 [Alca torda]
MAAGAPRWRAGSGGAEDGGRPRWRVGDCETGPFTGPGERSGESRRDRSGQPALPCPLAGAEARQRRLPEAGGCGGGGAPPAQFFLTLCVWRLVPRREAAGAEEVVFGKVGGSILLLCLNVSKEATEVVWFQGDLHSFPPLFSSRVAFPRNVCFSLADNSSLRITDLRAQDEGNYTWKEVLNKTDREPPAWSVLTVTPSCVSLALWDVGNHVLFLLIDPLHSTPKCWAETSSLGLMLQLFCRWPGGYPHPTLHRREGGHDPEHSSWVISSTSSSDVHVETLNSSYLSHRKVFKCVGSHVVKQEEHCCSEIHSLESEPPQTCFVGGSVTLTCCVTESTPAARITWLRDITQPEVEIQPRGRYLNAQEGNVSRLTIQNCSQGTDGGCYVCKAQNPVGLRELFVCLMMKQPVNFVGVVGAVVVLSLLAILTVTRVVLYCNPLLCLRGRSSPLDRDSGGVLVLVHSEDEDEGKGEEETMSSSTKHEAMAVVNGNSVQAAYLNCLTEGDDGKQHGGGSPQETKGEETRGT